MIEAWLAPLGVVALAVAGWFIGRWFGRLRAPYWCLGYAVALLLILPPSVARNAPRLELVFPFTWLMRGRAEFALLAFGSAMVFTPLLPRLRHRTERVLISTLVVFAVGYFTTPFVAPALVRPRLARIETIVNQNGVCLQGTSYSCGPAAAVTACRKLGIPAEESELAILAHTNPFAGTQPDSLGIALEALYADQGLSCEYRYFESVADLREAGLVITLIRLRLFLDHYVTVLGWTDSEIILGDPTRGRCRMSLEQFEEDWRHLGIVVRRK